MYDPTYAHHITMALYEDRLRLAAADARTRPSPATAVLRGLLGRGVRRVVRGRRSSSSRPCGGTLHFRGHATAYTAVAAQTLQHLRWPSRELPEWVSC